MEEVLGNVERLRAVTIDVLCAVGSEEKIWRLFGLLAPLNVEEKLTTIKT